MKNEKTDKLAKEAAEMPFVGPDPSCGLKQALHKRGHIRKASHWQNSLGQKQSKELLSGSPTLAKTVLSFSKEELLAEFLTSHAALKHLLHKLWKTEDQIRCLHQENLETAEHILYECVAFSRTRDQHFRRSLQLHFKFY